MALGGLAAWVLLAPNALAGFGKSAAAVLVLLGGFAGWTLLSGAWSHAPGLALIEFDRALLYGAVFALFALAGRTGARVRALIAILAVAALVVALIGLAAWLLPEQLHISASFERRRMSYPTGYWNTTGLLAGLGVVWSLHLASASHEHAALRVVGAAAIAPLTAVIAFTASRGALMATALGVIVYVLATRSRAVLVGLLACVPAAVASFAVVSSTPDLATTKLTHQAIEQGQRGAILLALCMGVGAALRVLLLVLERHLTGFDFPLPPSRVRVRASAAALLLVVAVGIAADLPGRASRAYEQFANGPTDIQSGVGHLSSLSGDHRTELWKIALSYGFAPHPVHGSGAGTFALLWERHRQAQGDVLVAHSLYIGTLGDLGIVGAGLLFAALVAILVALLRHSRRPGAEGAAWAGLLGAATVWLVFAAVDWNWEMPACTIWLLAVGGLALSRAVDGGLALSREVEGGSEPIVRTRRRVGMTWGVRVAIAGAAAALALIPLALERSDVSLVRAIGDLQRGDCSGAQTQATISSDAVSQRAEPYMVLAYCAAREGRSSAALGYAAAAVRYDPDEWEVHYALALVLAVAGAPPGAALHMALLRNPLSTFAIEAAALLERASPSARRGIALRLPIPLALSVCGGPTQADQIAPCGNPALPTIGPGPPVLPRPLRLLDRSGLLARGGSHLSNAMMELLRAMYGSSHPAAP